MAYDPQAVKVLGLNETIRYLRAIGTPDAELKAAAIKGADMVANTGRTLAPVGKTGKLKASIRSYATLRAAGVRAGKASVPYANPIHWGWFYDRENFIYKNIMPQPFLYKALGLKRQQILDTYIENMRKLINRYNKY
jgi:hypothetical protein